MAYTVPGVLQARILEHFPSPGDLPNPGIEPKSSALQTDSLPTEPGGKPNNNNTLLKKNPEPMLKEITLTQQIQMKTVFNHLEGKLLIQKSFELTYWNFHWDFRSNGKGFTLII